MFNLFTYFDVWSILNCVGLEFQWIASSFWNVLHDVFPATNVFQVFHIVTSKIVCVCIGFYTFWWIFDVINSFFDFLKHFLPISRIVIKKSVYDELRNINYFYIKSGYLNVLNFFIIVRTYKVLTILIYVILINAKLLYNKNWIMKNAKLQKITFFIKASTRISVTTLQSSVWTKSKRWPNINNIFIGVGYDATTH